jgi:hypothetical protein
LSLLAKAKLLNTAAVITATAVAAEVEEAVLA